MKHQKTQQNTIKALIISKLRAESFIMLKTPNVLSRHPTQGMCCILKHSSNLHLKNPKQGMCYNFFYEAPKFYCASFTGQFCIKAAKAYGESLKYREWVAIIHGENIFSNLPKLKYDLVRITLCHWWRRFFIRNKLKVFHRCHCNTPFEIKAPTLQLFMPSWGFISQNKGATFILTAHRNFS